MATFFYKQCNNEQGFSTMLSRSRYLCEVICLFVPLPGHCLEKVDVTLNVVLNWTILLCTNVLFYESIRVGRYIVALRAQYY